MSFAALKSLLGHTAKLYPRIFQRVREHLGARGTFWWVANVAEAALSERRENKMKAPGGETKEEGPAQEFARYGSFYKKTSGAID